MTVTLYLTHQRLLENSVSIKVREETIKGSPFTLTVTKTTAIVNGKY